MNFLCGLEQFVFVSKKDIKLDLYVLKEVVISVAANSLFHLIIEKRLPFFSNCSLFGFSVVFDI